VPRPETSHWAALLPDIRPTGKPVTRSPRWTGTIQPVWCASARSSPAGLRDAGPIPRLGVPAAAIGTEAMPGPIPARGPAAAAVLVDFAHDRRRRPAQPAWDRSLGLLRAVPMQISFTLKRAQAGSGEAACDPEVHITEDSHRHADGTTPPRSVSTPGSRPSSQYRRCTEFNG
jgi:hypothetical protein